MGGLGAAVVAAGDFREVTFYAQASYLRHICLELDVHFGPKVIPSSPWEPKVLQMAPRSPKGSPREAKVTPRRPPWEPKASQRVPKLGPKSAQESKMSSKAIQRRPTNHKTIYT